MQELPAAPRTGAHVEVRGEPWRVVTAEPYDRVTLVTLQGAGPDNIGKTARLFTPFDRLEVVRPPAGPRRRSRRFVLQTAAAAIAGAQAWRGSWTAGAARIDLRPWQLAPALAAIAGAPRILLADAVGLGKTIQALLVVSELSARGLIQRTLILTPASLRDQWSAELVERFGLRASVFDHASLYAVTQTLPPGVNPWKTAEHIIASIDLVKRPEVRAAIDDVAFDLIVVDEAHHLTAGSDRGAVVAELARRARWLVLITATPHSGDDAAYRFLCSLGSVGDGDDLVIFRRSSSQVRMAAPRRERYLRIAPAASEQALLDATLAYTRALWRSAGANTGARLVASVIARRAASSAHAARLTLERRLQLLRGTAQCEQQDGLPWDEDEGDDRGLADGVLASPGLADQSKEMAWLERLVRLAQSAAASSSKVAFVRALLRRTPEPLIVFSEYRDVVEHVASQLADLATVSALHGGLSSFARSDAIQSFLNGRARALVTTDTAGEGLNLQARCRLVINLELPWNPLRIEQRVGRVDRLGQTRRVHARHLYYRGSFEESVLRRLAERRDVAAGIFEGRDVDCGREFAAPPDSALGEDVTLPLAERRLMALSAGSNGIRGPGRPVYSWFTRRRTAVAHITLVFAADVVDARGRLLQREIVPIQVRGRLAGLRTGQRALQQLVHDGRVRRAVDEELAKRFSITAASIALAGSSYDRRLLALARGVARSHCVQPYQASLFDRRAEQQARARESSVRSWLEHLERCLEAARALQRVRLAGSRLVAAWVDQVAP